MGERNGQDGRGTEHRASLITSPARRELVWQADPDARYAVPTPGRFRAEMLEAPELAHLAAKIIGRRPALGHLARVRIAYLWKKRGGTRAGMPVLGACVRVSGIWTAFSAATWAIWLAADNCEQFSNWLIQCNLTHQLLHAGEGEQGEPTLVGHDFDGFALELEWCGAWTSGLTVMTRAVGQLQLPLVAATPNGERERATAPPADGAAKETTPIVAAGLPLFAEVTK